MFFPSVFRYTSFTFKKVAYNIETLQDLANTKVSPVRHQSACGCFGCFWTLLIFYDEIFVATHNYC